MVAQVRLHRNVVGHQRNDVLVLALAASHLRRQVFAWLDVATFALRRLPGRSPGCSGSVVLLQFLAPTSFNVLAVVPIARPMPGEVVEQVPCCRLVNVGNASVKRNNVADRALGVVIALSAAVLDWPRLLVVVGRNGCHGPRMSIARDLSAVVEIVEHPNCRASLCWLGVMSSPYITSDGSPLA